MPGDVFYTVYLNIVHLKERNLKGCDKGLC